MIRAATAACRTGVESRPEQVSTGEQEVRPGEEVEAPVTISSRRGLGDVELGLICTEYYDYEFTSTDEPGSSSRETAEATAHEKWEPVGPVLGAQSVRLTIPPEAPFSYEGDCLSFKWAVVAKRRRHQRLDAQAAREITVLP